MLLPVEVAADRPPEVVEIGDVVSDLVRDGRRLRRGFRAVVRRVRELLGHRVLLLQQGDLGVKETGDLLDVADTGLQVTEVVADRRALHAELERNGSVFDRWAERSGDALHPFDAGHPEDGSGDFVQHQHVSGITQIVVGLDHQQVRVQAGLGEVLVGRVVCLHRLGTVRQIVKVVVARGESRQAEGADDRHDDRDGENGRRPSHDGGRQAAPPGVVELALRIEKTEATGEYDESGRQRDPSRHHHQQSHCARERQRTEVGQPGELQAGQRPNNGQTGAQDHLADAGEHVVVGGFTVQAPFTALLVAADHENRVIGTRRDCQ